MKVALDAANGAAAVSARNIFLDLNAEIAVIGDQPDGLNINAGVGSTHPEQLQALVKELAQLSVLPLMVTVTVSSLLMKMVILLMVTR